MKTYGLIGYPLGHSFSENYFKMKFVNENVEGCVYKLFPLERISELPKLLKNITSCRGLNVTIPYKESVITYLDEMDETAKSIGAVNTILFHEGKSKGYNTDVLGFRQSFEPLLKEHHYKGALVLGTGGASKAVKYVLGQLEIPFKMVSRTKSDLAISYAELDEKVINEHPIIINTTPLGMFPHQAEAPSINYSFLNGKHFLFDMIYNPEKTLFLQNGEQQGAQIKNGFEMLHIQAEESWKIWITS